MQEYRIKQVPEDFVVRETSKVKLAETGGYTIFRLKKRNYTTEKAVQVIVGALGINRKRLGYAGNKDRNAVTEQNISIRNIKRERVESLKLRDIELRFLGYSNEPISLGDLEGNSFEIVVRNIAKQPKKINKIKKIINYFGEQRFSKYNAEIGRAIIKKDFKKAVDRILDSIGEDEEEVIKHLRKNKNDFVGALKRMPWKTLKLYVHAYQGKLWNEIAGELVKSKAPPANEAQIRVNKKINKRTNKRLGKENSVACGAKNKKIPLIGFATEIRDKRVKQIAEKVMQNEKINYKDFIIRQIPELSSAGSERDLFAEVKDLRIGKLEDDELNKGKKKVKISFSLGKGSYATEVVKELFS